MTDHQANGVAKASNIMTMIASVVASAAVVGAGGVAYVSAKTGPLEAAALNNRSDIDKIQRDLKAQIDREVSRNNAFEERISRQVGQWELFRDLYLNGKLRLE